MDGVDHGTRSREEEASRFLADQWQLEYREAHRLSIDPGALGILDAGHARTLGTFPLALEGDRRVFAIAEPTSERLDAIRAVGGQDSSFVVVSPTTLDALLNSKIFNPAGTRGDAAAPPPVAGPAPPPAPEPNLAEPALPPAADAPAQPPPAAEPPAPAAAQPPPAVAPPPLPVPTSPLPSRRSLEEAPAERVPARPVLVAVGPKAGDEQPSARLGNLLTQISADASNLIARAGELTSALEDSHLELRNARQQLEDAREENERARTTIEQLQVELARSDALNEAVTLRLRELVGALEASTGATVTAPASEVAELAPATQTA